MKHQQTLMSAATFYSRILRQKKHTLAMQYGANLGQKETQQKRDPTRF